MHFGRLLFFVVCAAIGAAVSWISQPYVHENSDATTVIVTVMTVLAGFMIAIITVLGDPTSVPDGTWRTVEARRENIESKIIRHAYLFTLYLLALAFLFAATVLKKVPEKDLWYGLSPWVKWIDYAYVFFGVTSFLLTFSLPFSLQKIQMERLKLEAQRRKIATLEAERKITED
jgi:hypothetical protein